MTVLPMILTLSFVAGTDFSTLVYHLKFVKMINITKEGLR